MINIDKNLDNIPDNNKHLINYILEYFKSCTKYSSIDFSVKVNNNNNILRKAWFDITNDLLNIPEIKNISYDNIEKLKTKNIDTIFQKSFNDLLSTELKRPHEHLLYLNKGFKQNLVTCNQYHIKHLYPHIFMKLWINNYINFQNEKIGLLIFNILSYNNYIKTYLSIISPEKNKLINFYINFLYQIYSNDVCNPFKKENDNIIKQNLISIISTKDYLNNDMIRNYVNFMMSKIKNYIGDYFVYSAIDTLMFIPASKKHLEHTEVISYINNNFCTDFEIESFFNIDYIFLGIHKYIFIYNGQIKYVGINKIDPHDENVLKNKIRTSKIKDIFDEN